jgi:hypothetical protein
MQSKNKKLDVDQIAKLILGLYEEEDRAKIMELLEKNEEFTPELEEAIKSAFKKQAEEMEKEIEEMEADKDEIEKYAENLRVDSEKMTAELDKSLMTIKTDITETEDGLDSIEEEAKEGNNQSQIEALRNKLLNK